MPPKFDAESCLLRYSKVLQSQGGTLRLLAWAQLEELIGELITATSHTAAAVLWMTVAELVFALRCHRRYTAKQPPSGCAFMQPAK